MRRDFVAIICVEGVLIFFPGCCSCLAHTGAARNDSDAGTRPGPGKEGPYLTPCRRYGSGGRRRKSVRATGE